jgi:hypothetical protein
VGDTRGRPRRGARRAALTMVEPAVPAGGSPGQRGRSPQPLSGLPFTRATAIGCWSRSSAWPHAFRSSSGTTAEPDPASSLPPSTGPHRQGLARSADGALLVVLDTSEKSLPGLPATSAVLLRERGARQLFDTHDVAVDPAREPGPPYPPSGCTVPHGVARVGLLASPRWPRAWAATCGVSGRRTARDAVLPVLNVLLRRQWRR